MSFILRATFWLTVLAFLLPAAGHQASARNGGIPNAISPGNYGSAETAAPDVDAGEMLSLAAQSAGDVLGFCGRNPLICERSQAVVAHVVRQSAFYGSQVFLWVTEKAKEEVQERASNAALSEQKPHTPRGLLPGI